MSILAVVGAEVFVGPHTLLAVEDLRVEPGEIAALVGAAGCGKTMLLRGLAGFVPMTGSVTLDGLSLARLQPYQRARAGLSVVAQNGFGAGSLTVAECLRLAQRGRRGGSPRWSRRSLVAALPGLERVADEEVDHLRAWERLAASIAFGLRGGPTVLLLDEPAAGLSDQTMDRLQASLQRLAAGGLAVVIATRDGRQGAALADRVFVARDGMVEPARPGARR